LFVTKSIYSFDLALVL